MARRQEGAIKELTAQLQDSKQEVKGLSESLRLAEILVEEKVRW